VPEDKHWGNMADGELVVRASGASAVRAVIDASVDASREPAHIQLLMQVPRPVPGVLSFPECSLRAASTGTVLLTVATARLSISFTELRPLMFRPVPVDPPLQALFASAVSHLLNTDGLDPHGVKPYLTGLAELVLRSALRTELDRVDAIVTRRREAVEYIRAHLSDPTLTAERIADALFISRRRLYQLFDDGDGVSGRIRQLRIDRAKELLSDPAHASRGIGVISKQCGFANAAHFSRTFRKSVGESPSDYRDTLLKSTDVTS
jgi:AraC-like DNA-binding protein